MALLGLVRPLGLTNTLIGAIAPIVSNEAPWPHEINLDIPAAAAVILIGAIAPIEPNRPKWAY